MISFYYGDNDFIIKRQVDALVQKFAEKYGAENVSRIDGADIEAQELLAEIVNINLFALHRLVVLDRASKNKYSWEVLGDNLSRVPDETELIIVDTNPDKRTKTFKKLKINAKTHELKQPKDYELSDFVRREAAEQKVEIKPDAVGELIAYTGGDQWRIASEIAKFRALDKLVTADLVRQFVEPELSANAFKLLDDLLNSRRDAARHELAKLRQTEDANKFFGLLASQIFALAAAVNADSKKPAEIAADLGVHPFMMQKTCAIARKISPRDVERIAKIIADTDIKIKSTGVDPWTLIEIAVGKI